jgi:hypothetical protein
MMKFITRLGASAILAFGLVSPAPADSVSGFQTPYENSCFVVWYSILGLDCSYDASLSSFGPWVGPINLGYTYYAPGGGTFDPAGPGIVGTPSALLLSGDITVTGSGASASVSGVLNLAAGERGGPCGQNGVCLVEWDGVQQTLAAKTVDRAIPNAALGGLAYTYELATNAFPDRLQPCAPFGAPLPCRTPPNGGTNFANQEFPSATAPPIPFFGAQAWTGPSAAPGHGIATWEGGRGNRNNGTTSTGVATNYNCTDFTTGGVGCFSGSVPGSPPPNLMGGTWGWENVLMRIETNAAGRIINAKTFIVQEYDTIPPFFIFDSYDGNYVEFTAFTAIAKFGSDNVDIQIGKKNPLSVVLFGSSSLDVSSVEITSLTLDGGSMAGSEIHGKAHITDQDGDGIDDLTAHFASNESDLRCGMNTATLSGIADGIPFSTGVVYNGISKGCP